MHSFLTWIVFIVLQASLIVTEFSYVSTLSGSSLNRLDLTNDKNAFLIFGGIFLITKLGIITWTELDNDFDSYILLKLGQILNLVLDYLCRYLTVYTIIRTERIMIELSVIVIIVLILDDVEAGFKQDFTLSSDIKSSINILKNKRIILLIPLVITLGILYDCLDEKTKVVNLN